MKGIFRPGSHPERLQANLSIEITRECRFGCPGSTPTGTITSAATSPFAISPT